MAQTQDTQQAPIARVEITGSAIKRTESETALPITVLTHADLERTGATTAQDLVNLIPSNFGGGVLAQNVGSTGNPSTANLRGLGAQYTLVLLNGRRVANYAFGSNPVDLNSIPMSAIERVEVLRDGASAIYGADAVAGVINFILRKDYQGAELSAYDSKVQQKGGNTRSFNFTGGYGDLATQNFNVLLSANHEVDDALKSTQRSFAKTGVRPDLGLIKNSPRNGIPNFNFTDSNGNQYTNVNPYRYKNCDNAAFALIPIGSPTKCGTDYVRFIDLIPKAKHDNIVARGVLQLNDDNEVYVEATHTRDETTAHYSPAPYTKPMIYPASGRFYPKSFTLPKGMTLSNGTVLTADTVVTPVGPMSGTWRTVAGGGRADLTNVTNNRFLVGTKGTIAGWDYDAALSYSKNKGEILFGDGQYSYAKLTPLIASGAINVFGDQDADSLAALQSARLTGMENSATSTAKEFDARLSKELMQMQYGSLGFAVGIDMRREQLEQISSDVMASGDQVGGNGPVPGVSGGRKVYSAYSELSVPLYQHLDLDLAARYDKYKNDFGTSFSQVSPKASLRYQPIKELMMRSSVAKGFRAPTLYQNLLPYAYGQNTNGSFSDPVRCPGGTPIASVNPVGALEDECNVQLSAARGGNPNLDPEKSKQFSLGMVFQPTQSISGSLDYWNIKIDHSIVQTSEIGVFDNPTLYQNNYWRVDPKTLPLDSTGKPFLDPTTLNKSNSIQGSTNKDFPLAFIDLPYANSSRFFASGLDLNLNYKRKIDGVGSFGVNLDGTYYLTHGYQYTGVGSVSDLGKYKDFGATPRWRHILTFTLKTGPVVLSLTHNYTEGYQDYTNADLIGPDYPAERRVSSNSTFDTQAVWTPIKNVDLALGIKNLTNQEPPSSRNDQGFQTGYDPQYGNPLGRVFYARAKYKFW
ncbi:TonB-dependent receptor [Massilia putida]|uniref:TonB-dependent receptor n=1 Tax=Massilia putida TaxID=1141883 RepID=UPI000952ACE9|nr:TonB-dependent receptor [Massilia putida]